MLWDESAAHAVDADGPSVVSRVLLVLEACANSNRALTLGELVKITGLPKTTLHRLCWKLVELGMLERANRGFRIGTKLFALGSMNPLLRRLRSTAMPYLHELAAETGWATNLAVLAEGGALVVEEVFGGQARARPRMIGSCLPLHATAVGKALLSGFEDAEIDALTAGHLQAFTVATLVRPNLLHAHLAEVRRTSVAFSHEEWTVGTSGVASPIRVAGAVVAAVAVVGEPARPGLLQRADPVRRAAREIEKALTLSPLVAAASAQTARGDVATV